ncbi:MAG: CocE/NonD family hydrolase [Candidatus Eisenbacteria bacterium]|uniref:CocE/NonD family hydrolase n=1 Tax=Eiseniibacteriota bacterium TaxID=2212470 RepID=A0A956NIT7_UNCEI|nr:CocE/NonD family hydrolase [Candidatus Eisenbacteria bacterium]
MRRALHPHAWVSLLANGVSRFLRCVGDPTVNDGGAVLVARSVALMAAVALLALAAPSLAAPSLATPSLAGPLLVGPSLATSSLATRVAIAGGYPVSETVQIPMGDGTLLNTEIWYPQGGSGPWPVILSRTPYNASGSLPFELLVSLGFVAIGQDIRGFYGSGGSFEMFRSNGWGPNHQDGKETLDWIVAQPWCDGHVGTFGASAPGITQNLLMGSVPNGLSCTHVTVGTGDLYEQLVFPGGTLKEADIVGWLNGIGYPQLVDSLEAHAVGDEWWDWLDVTARASVIETPSYSITGWYDLMIQGSLDLFEALQYGGGPGALGNQKLIVGPWSHGVGVMPVGELTYPNSDPALAEAIVGGALDWFNFWEKGANNGIMSKPPVAYYVMGDPDMPGAPGNEWRASSVWPPASSSISYYLGSGGGLSNTELDPGTQSFVFDPADPVPTLGGNNLVLQLGPYDQRPVESRSDVLLFETPPLTSALEVVGQVEVVLYASSDRLDTDFTAKLTDVYPDGRSMLVCDGVLRARFRNGFRTEELLTPGEVERYVIDLGSTALVFAPGHKIRLAVSSSNSPRFAVNPNHGGPFGSDDPPLIATNTVQLGGAYPSALVLPVVDPDPSSVPEDDTLSGGDGAEGDDLLGSVAGSFSLRVVGNPSRGEVRVALGLTRGEASVTVYDPLGRRVRDLGRSRAHGSGVATGGGGEGALADEIPLSWDGTDDHGVAAPAGVYFVRAARGNEARTARAVLIR